MPRSNSGRREIIKPRGPYSLPQAAKLARLPKETLRRWSEPQPTAKGKRRKALIPPSVHRSRGRGDWSQFSFRDVVALRTAAELRRAGASLQCLRRVAQYLGKVEKLDHPFAQARLVVVGDDILLVKGDRRAWSVARKPGQAVFGFVLDLPRIVQELRADAARLAEAKAIA